MRFLKLFICLMLCLWGVSAQDYNLNDLLPYDPCGEEKLGRSIEITQFPAKAFFSFEGRQLSYIAVTHTVDNRLDPTSLTFQKISEEIEKFQPNLILLEGFDHRDQSLEHMKNRVKKPLDLLWGEPEYAVYCALKHNIPFLGAEPTDNDLIQCMEQKGYTKDDVAYLYFTQQIHQIHRSTPLHEDHLPSIFQDFAQIWSGVFSKVYTYEDYQNWCTEYYGSPLTLKYILDNHATTPIGHGQKLQQISNDACLIRDETILRKILDAAFHYDRVLVVYGGSHYYTQHKVLERYLGKPTYEAYKK